LLVHIFPSHKGTGAPVGYPGQPFSLRLALSPQSLDPVEKQLSLLLVEEFVVEALSGFAQDRALGLVADGSAKYPVGGHKGLLLVVQASGCGNTAGATFI
jgi:hypothetical protein